MKAIRILFRSIRDSFKNVIRNFSLSLASILCVTITLILVSISIVATANVNNTTQSFENELSIIVYLNSDITDERINELTEEFKSIDEVASVEFKSQDDWKTELSESDEDFAGILTYLEETNNENPLLNSFAVYVDDTENLEKVAEYLSETPDVDTVKYGEGMVETIISVFDIVQQITIAIVIALVLVTAFLIGNTIKLTIFSRRSEIEIMRLVGASNMTIRLPFIFEGLIVGILGSIIPICITIYGYILLYTSFDGVLFTNMIPLIEPYNFVFIVSAALLSLGALVGMFGSIRAVRKYLKI